MERRVVWLSSGQGVDPASPFYIKPEAPQVFSVTLDMWLLIFYNGFMDLTERQELILNNLIREYIDRAEPISSNLLQKKYSLDVSPATVRNELQELTEQGYIMQPHTSAGRVPTEKAYKYFVDKIFSEKEKSFPDFIFQEIEAARQKIQQELKLAHELTKSLTQISTTLSYTRLEDKNTIFEMLKIIGPSQSTHSKNISLIEQILKEIENF